MTPIHSEWTPPVGDWRVVIEPGGDHLHAYLETHTKDGEIQRHLITWGCRTVANAAKTLKEEVVMRQRCGWLRSADTNFLLAQLDNILAQEQRP